MACVIANMADCLTCRGSPGWRGTWDATPRVRLFARLVNLLDTAYADRADFAFGGYRYFPAMPRQVYFGARVALAP